MVRYLPRGSTATEIADDVERSVVTGTLTPGQLLPPIRMLAADVGVNPNTVAAAYRQLRERGIVHADGRRGTRILPRPAVRTAADIPRTLPPGVRDLSAGEPSARLLPRLSGPVRRAVSAAAGRGYTDDPMAPSLATEATRVLGRDGVPTTHLAVTHSTLDSVERVLQAHLRPGDRVAVEDPSWASLLDLLAAVGVVPVPVVQDEEGVRPESLRAALRSGARAAVITSRAQVPTGAAMSQRRRHAVRRVLARHRSTVLVEDDHCAAVAGVEPWPLAGATDHWAYVRSVSKSWGPDLRVAVVAGDATTISRVRGRQRLASGWVSHLSQEIVVALWRDERAVARVRQAASVYAERRAGVIAALADRGVTAYGRSGINVWVPVSDETSAVTALLHRGWAVAPGARFRIASPPGLRITIASLDQREVAPLADAVSETADSAVVLPV